MSGTLAAALGGAAGAVALVGITIIIIRYCLFRNSSISRTSETNSSDPSLQVGQNVEPALGGGVSYAPEFQGARCFTLEELNVATKNFSNINLIGYGTFGEVSKGLLHDGMVVAIKRRSCPPSHEFIEEVRYVSSIRHRNLVSLLGYCQEDHIQMLIYEYIPNGSVSTHLYGAIQASSVKLEFKHRLSIAHGAAKGMVHLHSLNPPLVHMNFRTRNVLVDGDLTPKVADAGIRSLLDQIDGAASSLRITEDDPFLDPEYSSNFRISLETIFAQDYDEAVDLSTLVDNRMGSSFTSEGIRDLLQLISWCLNSSSEERPPIKFVELELHRIHEREMSLTTIMGEGTTTVTLGSQLFTTS
ncbi:STYKc [Musa troglodytarum]|uniref:non-specific serine/threonine protein kinase n=1 Tax=Musa troglodytarum TaxID=320322 RepID=A0A9E7F9K5_9LILI|nr:STYKc [Musa troglodytarum]